MTDPTVDSLDNYENCDPDFEKTILSNAWVMIEKTVSPTDTNEPPYTEWTFLRPDGSNCLTTTNENVAIGMRMALEAT